MTERHLKKKFSFLDEFQYNLNIFIPSFNNYILRERTTNLRMHCGNRQRTRFWAETPACSWDSGELIRYVPHSLSLCDHLLHWSDHCYSVCCIQRSEPHGNHIYVVFYHSEMSLASLHAAGCKTFYIYTLCTHMILLRFFFNMTFKR